MYKIQSPSGRTLTYEDIREAEVMAYDLARAYNVDVKVMAPSGLVVYVHSSGVIQSAY